MALDDRELVAANDDGSDETTQTLHFGASLEHGIRQGFDRRFDFRFGHPFSYWFACVATSDARGRHQAGRVMAGRAEWAFVRSWEAVLGVSTRTRTKRGRITHHSNQPRTASASTA
jgi:hypothetical protein